MTRSLYVLRHAKADELAPAGGDRERVLKRRGRKAAQAVGRFLTRLDEVPELVLCSSAARARETAELAREAGAWDATLELVDELYEARPADLRQALARAESALERVMLVGHQPSLSLFIAELTGSEPDFPTGALARLDLDAASWGEFGTRDAQLAWLVTPEILEAARRRP
jgi:phosphohistidine phosphatase